jgi:hypothetical protein
VIAWLEQTFEALIEAKRVGNFDEPGACESVARKSVILPI